MENTEEKEKIFYQDDAVIVTQSRFVSGGTTYAIRDISFVRKCKISKDILTPIFYIVVGIIFLIFSLDLFFRIAGGICVIIGILWLFLVKQKFSVRINTNKGKEDTIISKDEDLIAKIVYAVNNAVFYRG
jgi:hypothetical protein